MALKIILSGPPGAGKGTQAVRIAKDYGLAHISTGDIFRKNIREKTALGKMAQTYIDAGDLVPDDVTIAMVEDRLDQADCQNGFLLDGFPRTLAQATAFDEKVRVDLVLHVEVPTEALIERICGRRMCECGQTFHLSMLNGRTDCAVCGKELYQRDDDREDTVANRLAAYEEMTKPLIDHYDAMGVLVTVDGMQSIDDVYDEIVEKLGEAGYDRA